MYQVHTDHPVAVDSPDHLHPLGTANDNSSSEEWIAWAESRIGRPLFLADFGCAGGRLVHDMLQRCHVAIGIEGSDYSKVNRRAEWPLIPDHLFTADLCHPVDIRQNGKAATFDYITAWEVLEHIPEDRLRVFLENVRKHLAPGGVFVASVATFDAPPHHVTLHGESWWVARLAASGLIQRDDIRESFYGQWVRGHAGEPGRFHLTAVAIR